MRLPEILNFPNKDTRYPFLFLFLLALAALGSAVYFYFTGDDTITPWQTITELQPVSMPAGRFSVLLQNVDIRVKGFLVSERFEVGLPTVNVPAALMALTFISVSLVYYLAVISTLRQLPFIAGMLLFMLFFSSFNFDLLGIFLGTKQYIAIFSLTLFGGTAFALQAFFTQTSFRTRLLIFLFLMAGLGFYLIKNSPLPPLQTSLHLVHYASPALITAAILFIIWVAYENIHGLLWFHTQGDHPEKRFSLWQFLVITVLYLTNLLLIFLINSGIIRFNLILLNAYLILLTSAIVGLWGTKRREEHYRKYFTYESGGAFLYLIFGVLAATCLGYAFATANESLSRAFTDIIVYSHLAFGFFFLVYLLSNYASLIRQKLRVYRVVYNPKVIPFYAVYVLSFLLILVLLLRINFYTYNRIAAGHFNYLGDLYATQKNDLLSERFYTEASTYHNNNIKAATALAGIYNEKSYLQLEIKKLREALDYGGSPKLYIRLANKFTDQEKLFDHLFTLREGLKKFPRSPELLNNMGLVYASTTMVDSAEYFFNLAQKYGAKPEISESNRLAFYLKTGLMKQAKDRAQTLQNNTYQPLQANLLYLQSFSGTPFIKDPIPLPAANTLTLTSFATVYHASVINKTLSDKNTLSRLSQYVKEDANALYRFDLSVAKALIQARSGHTMSSRTTLENLAATEQEYSGFLLDMIGLKLIRQKLYAAAAKHFEQARAKGWPEAGLHHLYALALLPNRQTDALLVAADLVNAENPETAAFAQRLQYLIQATPTQIAILFNDSLKIQYLQINHTLGAISAQEFVAISSTVRNPELKLIAQKELARYYVSHGNVPAATQVIESVLPQLESPDALLSEVNWLQAEILLQTNNLSQLETALPRMHFEGQEQDLKYYYQALLADKLNRKNTPQLYQKALQVLPYHEQTVLAAANFYSKKQNNSAQAYDLLLNSITYNPYNPTVYKAYILKSIEMGYGGFAESALEDLAKLISPEAFSAFQTQVMAATKEREHFLNSQPL